MLERNVVSQKIIAFLNSNEELSKCIPAITVSKGNTNINNKFPHSVELSSSLLTL
eukprot:UN25723